VNIASYRQERVVEIVVCDAHSPMTLRPGQGCRERDSIECIFRSQAPSTFVLHDLGERNRRQRLCWAACGTSSIEPQLILGRRPVDVVDHDDLHRALLHRQLEPELLLDRLKYR
jgi:hypothetical protein